MKTITLKLGDQHREALDAASKGPVYGAQLALIGDIAGAVNQQWNVKHPPIVPPPDPSDPLARMRLAPGQLSMWQNVSSPEIVAMRAIHGDVRVSQQVGFYGPGMPGNVGVRQTGPSTYDFVQNGLWVPDVGGAGDAQVAAYAAASGIPVIGALTP